MLTVIAVLALSEQDIGARSQSTFTSAHFWTRCGSSLAVLTIALTLSACVALGVELLSFGFGRRTRGMLAFCGRALACVPVPALAWAFVGLWIGRHGGSVETLMPVELPLAESVWQTEVARMLWEFLAPALLLAIPLTGELIHGVISDAPATPALDLALRARGVPVASIVWRHRLRQLLPVAGSHLRALCLLAPVYLIVMEDVLRFMGWGGWMAQSLRGADVDAIAPGLVGVGCMLLILLGAVRVFFGSVQPEGGKLSGVAWQPWSLWALACMAVTPGSLPPWLLIGFAVLLASSAEWHRAWLRLEKSLPLEAARVIGGSVWRIWWQHLAWAQVRFLVAWISAALSRVTIWIVVACAVRPGWVEDLSPLLARWVRPLAIATSREAAAALADPLPVLEAGGAVALASLCLIQVSRIIQPRAH